LTYGGKVLNIEQIIIKNSFITKNIRNLDAVLVLPENLNQWIGINKGNLKNLDLSAAMQEILNFE